jgi:hypothetical protein
MFDRDTDEGLKADISNNSTEFYVGRISIVDEDQIVEEIVPTDSYESNEVELGPAEAESKEQRIFPCMSDAEARSALRTLIGAPHVGVEVVGGILRHDIR